MLPPAIEVGELPLTAFWSLLETPRAHCSVSAFWIPSWKPPAPPQPARQPCPPSRWSLPSQPQLEPTFCSSCWSWSVLELLETSVVAVEVAVWSAVDGPLLTSPPAIDTGTFAFTAVWWLLETPRAACSVSAFWTPAWKPPAPPQPATHEESPPTFWSSCWSWSVFELFETSVVAVEVAVWSAVDGPLLTSPPAIETGTFALTAVWSLFAIPTAACWVVALWRPAWKPPAPPE